MLQPVSVNASLCFSLITIMLVFSEWLFWYIITNKRVNLWYKTHSADSNPIVKSVAL